MFLVDKPFRVQMLKNLFIKVFFSELLLLAFIIPAFSQNTRQNTFIKFEQLTGQLGKKYNIQFFYKPEWFEMRTFNPSISELSLNEALDRLKSETDYSVFTIDSLLYIFVPVRPVQDTNFVQKYSDVITIGNPDEYGKYSKAIIQGIIIDGTNGKPLPGASVLVDKYRLGAIADSRGHYRLQAPAGEFTIRVTFIGYDETIQKVRLTGDGTLDLKIYVKSIKLDEVIVSADRPEINVTGSQMSYVRLDPRSIRELPVSMGVKDVIKSITLLPGVQTIGEFGTGFNVRGGSADQNLILLEDVPLFNSSHLFGLTSVVNSDGILGVTLTKAGISAQYGERASSLLDIRFGTGNPDRIRVRGGIGLIDSRLYVESPLLNKKASLLVSARRSYSSWLLHRIPDIDLMNSSAGFYDANALLTIDPSSTDKISLFGYFSSDAFGFTANTQYRYSNLLASVRWKHSITKTLYFNLSTGISNYRYNVTESDTLRRLESYEINSAILYKNLKWNFSWFRNADHFVDFGLNGVLYKVRPGERNPVNNESSVQPLITPSERAGEFALYLNDNYKLSPDVTLNFGLRYSLYTYLGPAKVYMFRKNMSRTRQSITDTLFYDNNQIIKIYSGLEPRFSMRFGIDENSSVKFSYNRIHQFINLISNTAVMTPSDAWKLSSPNIKPLRCDHFALGYFRNFQNNAIESSVEIYYKYLKNSIDFKNGARILLNPYIDADLLNVNGSNFGIELFIRKNNGRLTGWASYTYSRSRNRSEGVYNDDKINNNKFFPSNYDRPNNLILNGNYHLSRRWRLGGTFSYSTGRPVTLPELKFDYGDHQLLWYSDRNKYRLPAYHRLDVSVSFDESIKIRKKWKGSWTFSVINLYSRKNAYSVFYKKEEHMVSNEYRLYDTYMLYIIGKPFPSLTYNFSF